LSPDLNLNRLSLLYRLIGAIVLIVSRRLDHYWAMFGHERIRGYSRLLVTCPVTSVKL